MAISIQSLNLADYINHQDLENISRAVASIKKRDFATKKDLLKSITSEGKYASQYSQAKQLAFMVKGKAVPFHEYIESIYDFDDRIDRGVTTLTHLYEEQIYLQDAADPDVKKAIASSPYEYTEAWAKVSAGKNTLSRFFEGQFTDSKGNIVQSTVFNVYMEDINEVTAHGTKNLIDVDINTWNNSGSDDKLRSEKVLQDVQILSITTFFIRVSDKAGTVNTYYKIIAGPGTPIVKKLLDKYDLIKAIKLGGLKKLKLKSIQIGHTVAASTQSLFIEYKIINELLNDRNFAPKGSDTEQWLIESKNAAEEVLQRVVIVDRLFLEVEDGITKIENAKLKDNTIDLKPIFTKLMQLSTLTGHEVELFTESSPGNWTSRGLNTSIKTTIYIIEGKAWNADGKGTYYSSRLKSLWRSYIAGTYSLSELQLKLVELIGSTSILGQAQLIALDKVFKTKKFSKKIIKSKKIKISSKTKKSKVQKIDNKKALAYIAKSNKRIAKTRQKIKNYKATRKRQSLLKGKPRSTSFGTNNLLDTINSYLEQAVIATMVYPSLQHRTGRFASSVKVLGLTEEQNSILFDFVYKKNPYQVFSGSLGKSPWNSQVKRDPEYIVTEAVKSIVYRNINNINKTVKGKAL